MAAHRPACAGLTNADQRITEDVEKFCFAVADLYSYTFKPLLDVLLFTRSLAKSMGYRSQVGWAPRDAWLGCTYRVRTRSTTGVLGCTVHM